MATYLDRILERHREVASVDRRSVDALIDEALAMAPARGFRAALAGRSKLGVISEIKRRSPSKGDLNAGLDPVWLAGAYERGGASLVEFLQAQQD